LIDEDNFSSSKKGEMEEEWMRTPPAPTLSETVASIARADIED